MGVGIEKMTFEQIIVMSVAAFLAVLVAVSLILRVCGSKSFAWSFATAYLLFSVGFHALFWTTYPKSQGAVALLIPLGLALPGSFLGVLAGGTAGIPLSVLGGCLQYFGIGWIVDRVVKKREECQHPNRDVFSKAADGL